MWPLENDLVWCGAYGGKETNEVLKTAQGA